MTERVQKLIAAGGACSRRTAEEWIRAGRVTVNGRRVSLGDRADPDTDVIAVDGRAVGAHARKVYLMLHKPRGFVTTLSDERGRRTAAELVQGCGARVFPVGRLDRDSEGLLLFTNDGALAQRLLHPSHQVDKVYEVTVTGELTGAAERLASVDRLDGEAIVPGPGAGTVPHGGESCAGGHHPPGQKAADTPYVRPGGAGGGAAEAGGRGRAGAGRAALRPLAVSDQRGAGHHQRKRRT